MKRLLLLMVFIACLSCKDDDNEPESAMVQVQFNHQWNGEDIDFSTANDTQFQTAHGEMVGIERLRYLISDIIFTDGEGNLIILEEYHLVDMNEERTFRYDTGIQVPTGVYSNVSFRFGFEDQDNRDGAYSDLNAANWNVPSMLGGGYHFMQLEGRFINNDGQQLNYQFHTIRAAQNPGPEVVTTDSSFRVDLGTVEVLSSGQIAVNVDLAEWFKNPNQWNLSNLYTMLMPNYEAQIMMSENGPSVFSQDTVLNP